MGCTAHSNTNGAICANSMRNSGVDVHVDSRERFLTSTTSVNAAEVGQQNELRVSLDKDTGDGEKNALAKMKGSMLASLQFMLLGFY